ncbi:mucin-like glycoprotein [Trypanosoma conorhini]|uniref:Mucin-like glycoprotein n=1 Tax=Trypanosoma conorhini TaxID=83891 RepID=A0A422MRS0_9TRYP|nr:mucin-like glycoprotein [Trypanosoma conorhini]RNE95897.1 mucin-like glycoprotein [Trypanosoma conorhini]
MTTLTVRRRAVCALALLALLCGCCCASVCGATAGEAAPKCNVSVPVEVSCRGTGENLRFRVRGNETWVTCALDAEDRTALSNTSGALAAWEKAGHTVAGAEVNFCDAGGDLTENICIAAEFLYVFHQCGARCAGHAAENTVAFTMNIMDREEGELHKELQGAQARGGDTPQNSGSRVDDAGETGVCPLTAAPQTAKEEEADALTGTAGREASPQPQTGGLPQGAAAGPSTATDNTAPPAQADASGVGSAVTGVTVAAGNQARTTPSVPSAGSGVAAGGQTEELREENAEDTAESDDARAPAESEAKTPAAGPIATSTDDTATPTDGDSGSSPATQPQPGSSMGTNESGQREQEQPAVTTAPKQETERSGERRGEATQPAAGAAAQAATTSTNSTSAAKAAPGDSDGSSTAAAPSASPLALLLLLACAAAAAVLAA